MIGSRRKREKLILNADWLKEYREIILDCDWLEKEKRGWLFAVIG